MNLGSFSLGQDAYASGGSHVCETLQVGRRKWRVSPSAATESEGSRRRVFPPQSMRHSQRNAVDFFGGHDRAPSLRAARPRRFFNAVPSRECALDALSTSKDDNGYWINSRGSAYPFRSPSHNGLWLPPRSLAVGHGIHFDGLVNQAIKEQAAPLRRPVGFKRKVNSSR